MVFDKHRQCLTVTDTLECSEAHDVELHWHLGERCQVTLEGQVVSINTGERQLCVRLPENAGLTFELVRGDSTAPLGWVSRAFDVKQPCDTLRCSGRFTGNVQLQTVFELAGGC